MIPMPLSASANSYDNDAFDGASGHAKTPAGKSNVSVAKNNAYSNVVVPSAPGAVGADTGFQGLRTSIIRILFTR